MTHLYLKDNKNAARLDQALKSQSFALLLMRVPLTLNNEKIRIGYPTNDLFKYYCKNELLR